MFQKGLKINSFLIFGLLLIIPFTLLAQKKSRAQLEKEKKETIRRIETANKILSETSSQKKATLGQLNALRNKINAREKLIESVSEEIELLTSEIETLESYINSLNADIELLKKEYASMAYSAMKMNTSFSKLAYIFSAESFSQMAMRIKYFQHYSELRLQHLAKIEENKTKLEFEKSKLENKISEKNSLLNTNKEEAQALKGEKEQQHKVLNELSEKEKGLKKELDAKKRAFEKLEKLITNMIAAEREKAIREAKLEAERKRKEEASSKKTSGKSTTSSKTKEAPFKLELTPEAKALSGSFAGNEGKLPWPVVKGNIAQRFGKQPHPVLKGVYIDNLGIDIQTLKEEPVRSVFQGKVITVAEVPGMNKVVMVQHGEYFTVYAKLRDVIVKTGDEITSKQKIGTVYTDKDNESQLQFQIWKNNQKLNPEGWLFKKK